MIQDTPEILLGVPLTHPGKIDVPMILHGSLINRDQINGSRAHLPGKIPLGIKQLMNQHHSQPHEEDGENVNYDSSKFL